MSRITIAIFSEHDTLCELECIEHSLGERSHVFLTEMAAAHFKGDFKPQIHLHLSL
jgi:hypothetical protein